MKVYSISFALQQIEGGLTKTKVVQRAYSEDQTHSVEEAAGKFLTDVLMENMGWNIHTWSSNIIILTDKKK